MGIEIAFLQRYDVLLFYKAVEVKENGGTKQLESLYFILVFSFEFTMQTRAYCR